MSDTRPLMTAGPTARGFSSLSSVTGSAGAPAGGVGDVLAGGAAAAEVASAHSARITEEGFMGRNLARPSRLVSASGVDDEVGGLAHRRRGPARYPFFVRADAPGTSTFTVTERKRP